MDREFANDRKMVLSETVAVMRFMRENRRKMTREEIINALKGRHRLSLDELNRLHKCISMM